MVLDLFIISKQAAAQSTDNYKFKYKYIILYWNINQIEMSDPRWQCALIPYKLVDYGSNWWSGEV